MSGKIYFKKLVNMINRVFEIRLALPYFFCYELWTFTQTKKMSSGNINSIENSNCAYVQS